jgi:hypothetical protein
MRLSLSCSYFVGHSGVWLYTSGTKRYRRSLTAHRSIANLSLWVNNPGDAAMLIHQILQSSDNVFTVTATTVIAAMNEWMNEWM